MTEKKEREYSPKGRAVVGYREALEQYMKEKRINQKEAIKKIGITWAINNSAKLGKKIHRENIKKIEKAGLSISLEE